MRIPQLIAGVLVARQSTSFLPSTFCSPECPGCKDDVANFGDGSTACVENSSFIQNCGLCQSCVMTYSIENGGIGTESGAELALVNILNLCENSSISADIQALQSQASRLSSLGASYATTVDPALASMMSSLTITSPPTATPTDGLSSSTRGWRTGDDGNTSWESILSTASWASYYYAHKSAESASLASASAALAAKETASSAPKPTQSSKPAPLNPTWIAGPVIGSVMGICTVITAIFFTRRKQRKDQFEVIKKIVENETARARAKEEDNDNDSAPHSPTPPREEPQLHAEPEQPPTEAMEMANTEVELHELPAVEPVGSELSTPMEARMRDPEWPVSPLPLSPLPLLFAMSEMRDQRVGDQSPRHDTFYHP